MEVTFADWGTVSWKIAVTVKRAILVHSVLFYSVLFRFLCDPHDHSIGALSSGASAT